MANLDWQKIAQERADDLCELHQRYQESALKALDADIKTGHRIAALEKSLDAVYAAGMKGIGYVAAANYPEREQEAIRNLQKAYDAALKGAKQ